MIKQKAAALGFQLVGVAPAAPLAEADRLRSWVEAGCAGKMGYMGREVEKRCDAGSFLPGARSVVVCGMSYNRGLAKPSLEGSRGWVSQYAWGDDYHDVVRSALVQLLLFIREVSGSPFEAKIAVDSSPIAEKPYGRLAGLGWIGKNTCLLNQRCGSKFFLGEIISAFELDCDDPDPRDGCGKCELCLESCPAGALFAPGRIDSRLCISYLTIELKGELPAQMAHKTGDHLFGCDICQDVCPWNKKAAASDNPHFAPRPGIFAPDLADFLDLCLFRYEGGFRKSPLKRAKRKGLAVNAMAAMVNSGDARYLPALARAAEMGEEGLSQFARSAADRLAGSLGKSLSVTK